MKILYIVGTGSKNNNQELRWSLRSLEKHCAKFGEVTPVIVGSAPDWFAGEHLDMEDPCRRKEKNIYAKIRAAAEQGLVDGEFQISADDHFYVRDYDLAKLPIYWRETMMPEFKEGGNNYAKSLAGTRRVLLSNGIPAINTTVHCNQWVNVEDFAAADRLQKAAETDEFAAEFGLVNWGLFPNLAIASGRNRRPIEFRHDVKFGLVPAGDFAARMADSFVISCNDDAFDSYPFMTYMEREFSAPCRWEK